MNTTQRRVVRNTLQLGEEPQTIAAGHVVLARAARDYHDDIMASRLELWIDTEVALPNDNPRPGQPTEPWPTSTLEVVVLGTGTPIEDPASWVTSVDDAPLVWHIYAIAAHGAPPQQPRPAPGPCWQHPRGEHTVRCELDAGHAGAHRGGRAGDLTGQWTWPS